MKSTKHNHRATPFKLHQEIVYPLQGVGQITSIEEKLFKGENILYYVIYLEVTDMIIMVPVGKAEQLGIRAIVSSRESKQALKLVAEDHEPITADWKMRYQMNLDLLKSGSVMDIATVVRTLYHRSRIKELPILERKLFDNALKLLVDEVSFSLGKTKGEVEEMIFSNLESE
jgi:CarD family transcriptional regulator